MAKRKKRAKRFGAVEAVKALARERIGSPPAKRVAESKKRKQEKHKAKLEDLVELND